MNVTMKCVMRSSTSLDDPYPLTAYVVNPSSNRAAADKRRSYIMGVTDWIHEVTYSFRDYGKSRLTP